MGGVIVTFASPTRDQKIRARKILRSATAEMPMDTAEAEAQSDALEDAIEALLAEMVVRVRREGGDSISGEAAQQAAVELGFLRGPDGGALFREVCFRPWTEAEGSGPGGPGGAAG